MSPPVVVAVVSWNTRELLAAALRSLAADHDAGRAEVWVVDNASTDGSPELVRDRFDWVRLIDSGSNLGFGAAVNLVAERTAGEWIAPANADIALEPEALAAMLRAGRADPGIGAVAPRLLMPGGDTQHSVHPFPTVGLGIAFNLGLARVVPGLGPRLYLEGHWDADLPRDVDWAHGAFLLVRRRAFERAGGFDPAQWMYAEDLDLAWRLREAGYRIRFEPGARVAHRVSAATRQAFDHERVGRHLAASYTWMARRQGIARTWAYAALNVAGAGARWVALAPLAAIAPGRWREPRRRLLAHARLHRVGLRRRRALLAAGADATARDPL